ncbi:Sec-independent protein translocase subunit TatA [Streptomyces sp. CBMA152]|uniref:Sec-independent protein translocase subunit TatA n=1 Tax=Streptomyces sp. CBMA152 TaxID=1896312 RepID=UPI001660867E|nr:Sec-independent protein translocase subunit TatA [Streptomyces sp. CBMA152]MBD0746125.1 preprotein translocase subunit TatA [Streptomyces sp. CBMA152]
MFLRNGLEPWHLLIVAVVLILLFGSKKLPDTARALGKSLRILKSETRAMKEESTDTGATPGPAAEATPRTIPSTPVDQHAAPAQPHHTTAPGA